jgi:hypothetical protein
VVTLELLHAHPPAPDAYVQTDGGAVALSVGKIEADLIGEIIDPT